VPNRHDETWLLSVSERYERQCVIRSAEHSQNPKKTNQIAATTEVSEYVFVYMITSKRMQELGAGTDIGESA